MMSDYNRDYELMCGAAYLGASEPARVPVRAADRGEAVERALRDLMDEIVDAMKRNPRIINATRAMLEARLEEAARALNQP